jgi:putative ABC transport system permease protein
MASAASIQMLGFLAIILLSAAMVLGIWGSGLVNAFSVVACLLIGSALALPVLVAIALSAMQKRSISPVWNWFWADTRHQLPGLSLALMALLLAVSANIGVSTMVSSFRLTFTGFLDQRLAPELFIEVDNADKSAQLEAYLVKKNIEVLPLLAASRQIAGQPARLFGIRVSPTYRDNWVFLSATSDVWDRVELGIAVVINEQLARRAELWVGDTVDVTPDFSMPVAGVVGDYGNPKGQLIVSEAVLRELQPDIYPSQFGVRSDDVPSLRKQIILDLGLSSKTMIDQAVIKAMSMEVFDRTFTVTRALNVLTLGVAGFALLMSLLTLADLRIPQLAPVWALGLTRRQLGGLELLRALAMSSLVFACALPLGLALAWVLLCLVNVEAFGWRLPMYIFPGEYMKLGAYAIFAALLAAAWPSLKLMRTPPSILLKVFSNER